MKNSFIPETKEEWERLMLATVYTSEPMTQKEWEEFIKELLDERESKPRIEGTNKEG